MKWHEFNEKEEKTWPAHTGGYLVIRKSVKGWSYAWFDNYVGYFYESHNEWLSYTDVVYWLEVKLPKNLPWPIDNQEEL